MQESYNNNIQYWTYWNGCNIEQCCRCLFVSGRTVVYRSHYKRPQSPHKVDFGGPNYRLQASHVASHVDWPSRTMLTVRPVRQDGVLPRRRTTTAMIWRRRRSLTGSNSQAFNQVHTVQRLYVLGPRQLWPGQWTCLISVDFLTGL